MRYVSSSILAWILTAAFSFADEPSTLQQQYLNVYLKINEAEHLLQKDDYRGALVDFKDCYSRLEQIQASDPNFEQALLLHRMSDCKAQIRELEAKLGVPATPFPITVQSGVAGGNSSGLPLNKPRTVYPWKTDITTTVFWIGEGKASAWDANRMQSNSGEDSPVNRNGYAPANHAATVNPFYVALPFNDLAFPEKARKWLPPGWQRPLKNGKPVSSCEDRWVEIKNVNGDVCYAQWEDIGPQRNDHAEYVFGGERPGPGDVPGLSISPAVRDYLHKSDVISWRFVEADDVRPGAWLKYDEQAVIYQAMHQQKGGVSSTSK